MLQGGESENAIGEVLKKYPRESFILTDKNPAYLVNSPADVHKLFNEQLKKCQVEYFDNYMVHNINKNTIRNYRDNDMYGELLKLKKEGKIKHLGFSFHGDPKMLREVISEHKWDFCQLQLNYLDWEVVNADELYQIADEAGVPVIVMEPLRGGVLCNLPEKAANHLKEKCPNDTQASFGLRWIAGKERVFTILSGMSNLQQLKENVDTFVNYREITPEDGKLICLFGCGGDRDATKRPKMGAIAEKLADKIVITSDNPRSEDPQVIITDIIAGLKSVDTKNVIVEPDRGSAIALLKTIANNNDVVVIAGKGHEDYQILKDKTIHFDDREEARKVFEVSVI